MLNLEETPTLIIILLFPFFSLFFTNSGGGGWVGRKKGRGQPKGSPLFSNSGKKEKERIEPLFVGTGNDLCFQAVSRQVLSAC